MPKGRYRIVNRLEDECWAIIVRLAVPKYRRGTMTSCLTRDMRVKWTFHGRVSRIVDSSGFPVGF